MEEVRATKQGPLNLDWDKLLSGKDDNPPTILIVKSKPPAAGEARTPAPAMGSDRLCPARDELIEKMSDHDLCDKIRENEKKFGRLAKTLPDKGEKLRIFLRRLEDERERRKRRRVETIQLEVLIYLFIFLNFFVGF